MFISSLKYIFLDFNIHHSLSKFFIKIKLKKKNLANVYIADGLRK